MMIKITTISGLDNSDCSSSNGFIDWRSLSVDYLWWVSGKVSLFVQIDPFLNHNNHTKVKETIFFNN